MCVTFVIKKVDDDGDGAFAFSKIKKSIALDIQQQ